MKALYKFAPGPGNLALREAARPSPEAGQVVIRVQAAGICGSDLHIRAWDTRVTMRPPVIIGHEFSGVIDELGPGVEGWQVGDRVTAEPSYSVCGRCLWCRSGSYNLCPERRVLGFWADGAFAEYTRVPADRLHRLPVTVSYQEGALVEPLACCAHAVLELTGGMVGDLAVVIGPGTIGLLAMQVAKAAGARVIVLGTRVDGARLEVARELGASHVVNVDESDPRELVMALSGGVGADVVIECSGAPAAVDVGLDLVRRQGRYTQIGLSGRPVTADLEKIAYKELRIAGSFAQKWTAWVQALALLERGEVHLQPLITDVLPLAEWDKAFAMLARKEGLKIVLEP
jgi:L-iditol 2-dehydrogenase